MEVIVGIARLCVTVRRRRVANVLDCSAARGVMIFLHAEGRKVVEDPRLGFGQRTFKCSSSNLGKRPHRGPNA